MAPPDVDPGKKPGLGERSVTTKKYDVSADSSYKAMSAAYWVRGARFLLRSELGKSPVLSYLIFDDT